MRISTNTIYESGAGRLSELQSALVRQQEQIATGRRMLTPADDPVASARALEVSQTQSVNSQYATNRQNVRDSLTQEETALHSIGDVLTDVKTLIIQAGNATLSDSDRKSLATAAQGHLDTILGLANSRDGTGKYLFSGYQTNTAPFRSDSSGVTYMGDQGKRVLQVGPAQQMEMSDSGGLVFDQIRTGEGGTGQYQSLFVTLQSLVNTLNASGVGAGGQAAQTTGLTVANNNITNALDNILTVRAAVGARLNSLDQLDVNGSDKDIQYSQTLSSLQDLDYAKAISEFTQQQTTLTAAQQSFVKITGLSLFNYL